MKKITKIASIAMVGGILLQPAGAFALTKNETVYTNLDAYGNIEKNSITNHLYINDQTEITDETELKEILNINGNETFTQRDNQLIWNGGGKDIFYRGVIEKTLPIEAKIEYYLNDEQVNVEDIIEKSGTIKIQIKFQNNSKKNVKVNGSNMTLYTPFVVTMGMILNNEDNTNIQINNGKVVDSGTRNMIIGIASPGMYNNFKIKELQSLDKISITYETTNFSLGDIYLVATPKLLENTDLSIFNKMNSLSKSVNTLQTSMDSLEAGAKKLEEGSGALMGGSTELMTNLQSAVKAVKKLQSGSVQVQQGLEKIVTELNTVSSSLSNPKVQGSIAQLKSLKGKNNSTKNSLTSMTGMDYASLMNYYQTNLVSYVGEDANILSLKSTCELILLLEANNQALDTMISTLTGINTQVQDLLKTLNTALTELNNGAKQVSGGLTQLETGLSKLYEGSKTLENGTKTLNSGINELSMGICKMNKEGINTLSKYSKTMVNYSNKAEALVNLSQNYHGYASNNVSNTTFVYMIRASK